MPTEIKVTHTPGPWDVIPIGDMRGVDEDELDPDALVIASVILPRTDTENGKADVICDLWKLDDGDGSRRAEVEANAALLAAAPALLDALKTTAGNIRSLGPAGALKNVPMEYREWLRVVDAAIAKAEGR